MAIPQCPEGASVFQAVSSFPPSRSDPAFHWQCGSIGLGHTVTLLCLVTQAREAQMLGGSVNFQFFLWNYDHQAGRAQS
jgi:hypothetical protein